MMQDLLSRLTIGGVGIWVIIIGYTVKLVLAWMKKDSEDHESLRTHTDKELASLRARVKELEDLVTSLYAQMDQMRISALRAGRDAPIPEEWTELLAKLADR